VIGKVHPQGVPAMALLESEGFRPNGLVDIFDAGPTVACGRDNIRTVRDARVLAARIEKEVEVELPSLVSTDSVSAFRAVRARVLIDGDVVRMTPDVAAALKIKDGAVVRVKS
ncbi:MAG TPA: arginine N-succinyltransferase, partial [Brevundimonas sp.]|nr:arginine N-succinyltransferase [Brevundimonas sp.]